MFLVTCGFRGLFNKPPIASGSGEHVAGDLKRAQSLAICFMQPHVPLPYLLRLDVRNMGPQQYVTSQGAVLEDCATLKRPNR